jgi:hypothetical protein
MIEPAAPHTARDTKLAPAVTPTLRLLEVMNTADNRGTAAPTAKLRQLVKAACQGDDNAYLSVKRRFLVGSWGFE